MTWCTSGRVDEALLIVQLPYDGRVCAGLIRPPETVDPLCSGCIAACGVVVLLMTDCCRWESPNEAPRNAVVEVLPCLLIWPARIAELTSLAGLCNRSRRKTGKEKEKEKDKTVHYSSILNAGEARKYVLRL